MKPHVIKETLRTVITAWRLSLPENLRTTKVIITGGAIGSLLTGSKANDYDIYFTDKDAATAIAKHYVGNKGAVERQTVQTLYGTEDDVLTIVIPSKGQWVAPNRVLDNPEVYEPRFISRNAITLNNDIQLITRFIGTPEYIHKHFDFRHATNYYCYETNTLHLKVEALTDLMNKTLHYQGSLYPLASLFRLKKFLLREWRCTAGEIIKIAHQCSKIEWDNTCMMTEQLTGVDLAYMESLQVALAQMTPEKRLDSYYVMEVIDRIFTNGRDDDETTESPT